MFYRKQKRPKETKRIQVGCFQNPTLAVMGHSSAASTSGDRKNQYLPLLRIKNKIPRREKMDETDPTEKVCLSRDPVRPTTVSYLYCTYSNRSRSTEKSIRMSGRGLVPYTRIRSRDQFTTGKTLSKDFF